MKKKRDQFFVFFSTSVSGGEDKLYLIENLSGKDGGRRTEPIPVRIRVKISSRHQTGGEHEKNTYVQEQVAQNKISIRR